jgi:predicted signal transduction protein with EAL and GGDEF domain
MTNLNIMELVENVGLFLKIFNNVTDMVYLTKVEGQGQYSYILANEPGKKLNEFAILLTTIKNDQEPTQIAKDIIQTLQKPWEIGEHRFKTTSSIGIAYFPPYELDQSKLLKNADIALYQAKEKGRNSYQVFNI